MRAVKGSLGHSLNRDMVNRKALARATGTSRRASGWAGEKVARSEGYLGHPAERKKRVSEADGAQSIITVIKFRMEGIA
jgi:hypothetical protein